MDDLPGLLARIAKMLDLDEGATEDDILAALKAMKDGEPDPRKYVPIEAMREAMAARLSDQRGLREERARAKVETALESGAFLPAAKGWALSLCMKDEAAFDTFLATTGTPYAYLTKELCAGQPPNSGGQAVSTDPDVMALCAQLGLSPDRLKD